MHPELPAIHDRIEQRERRKSSFPRVTILVALAMTLQACATAENSSRVRVESREVNVNSSSLPNQRQADSGDSSTPLEQRRFNIERAEFYRGIADLNQVTDEPTAAERIDANLSAAEYYIQAGDYDETRRALTNITDNDLSPVQQDRYAVIAAYIDYSRQQYSNSLDQLADLLSRPAPVEGQVSTQVVDALLLGSFNYQALNQFEAAIDALIRREQFLYGAARAETSRYIWQVINALSVEQKQDIMLNSGNAAVRNRIEQSSLGQIGRGAQTPAQFDQWRDVDAIRRGQIAASQWDQNSARNIAVILPLSSKFSKAAQALLDGLNYQHDLNNSLARPAVRVYDAGDNPFQITQTYAAAMANGADFIIGPLGRDYANQLSTYALQYGEVPTLLLGGDSRIANQVMRLTMSPEQEGITVAKRALAEGHVTGAILVPETSNGQRTADSFARRWLANGGRISNIVNYSSQQFDHSTELRQLFTIPESEYRHARISDTLGIKPKFSAYRRADLDFIFMIANNKSGRIVRPQINFFSNSDLPVYAGSSVYNGIEDPTNNIDLDHTAFPVMPWIIRSVDVSPYAGQLNMLFAMGADAYRIAGNLSRLRGNPELAIEGDMGLISVNRDGGIEYQMQWAEFEEGVAVPRSPIDKIDAADQHELNRLREAALPKPTPSDAKKIYDDSNWDSRQSRRKSGS